MKRRLLGAVIALAMVLVGAAGADAATPSAVTKRDAASTTTFIALQERYVAGVIRVAPAINAAERAFTAQIRAGCPDLLASLPHKLSRRQGGAVRDFVNESLLAFEIDGSASLRTLVNRAAGQQRRLRFSDPALQWRVRVTGTATAAFFELRPPNLCTDGRLLVSSRFTRITPAGARFVRDALAVDQSAAASPWSLVRMMRAYAPAAAATAIKRLLGLHRTLDRKLARDRHVRALLGVLGLTHLSAIDFAAPGATS